MYLYVSRQEAEARTKLVLLSMKQAKKTIFDLPAGE